jgi:hypothetical protein
VTEQEYLSIDFNVAKSNVLSPTPVSTAAWSGWSLLRSLGALDDLLRGIAHRDLDLLAVWHIA